MLAEVALLCATALALSTLLTGVVRKIALSYGVLDIPNARSSHTNATPRGGGASIVLVASLGFAVMIRADRLPVGLATALLVGGLAVAAVGFLDDRYSVPASVRFAIHLGAAFLASECLGGLSTVRLGDSLVQLGWFGQVLAVLTIVWALNLFNFMDGIDGFAASEAVFILGVAGVLGFFGLAPMQVGAVGLLVGAACAGFLVWNWPPARIFMGDVGSGYLGYIIGVLAIAATRQNPAAIWIWLILGGAFFVDATVTLLRRAARGDRVYQAHRSHAYQWLARRWRSHKRVTVSLTAVNFLWLLPCCCFAAANPGIAGWTALVALIPLVAVAIAAGAGRHEQG
jgi:Fuc2NAc and GlcNAc transferase